LSIIGIQNIEALSLQQAESIAISRAPEIKEILNKELALRNKATASAQWKDPVLYVGALNVPTNSFSFKEDPMTMLKFVVEQKIPKGHSSAIKYQMNKEKALALSSNKTLMRIEILRELRRDWVTRYYLTQVKSIYLKERVTFEHLFSVSKSMFANNKTEQNALFNARMQIAKMDERLIDTERAYHAAEVNIGRWIGENKARAIYPKRMPGFPKLPALEFLKEKIKRHPKLELDSRLISSAKSNIALKEQDYKPQYSVGLSYAYRDQQELGGIYRSDFVSAQVFISLPVFPKNRQNKRLEESKKKYLAKTYLRDTDYRDLSERLRDAYINFQATGDELKVYESRILPDAEHYADSTLIAYQNLKTEFPILADAYIEQYNLILKKEKSRLDHALMKIELLYLQGR
jgi:outer membrane protein TolC